MPVWRSNAAVEGKPYFVETEADDGVLPEVPRGALLVADFDTLAGSSERGSLFGCDGDRRRLARYQLTV